jgi:2-methylcitrate dehydratase PrpD
MTMGREATGGDPAAIDAIRDFLLGTGFRDLPPDVVKQAQRCLLDLAGVAAAGSRTPVARITARHAAAHMTAAKAGERARLLMNGARASAAAAAMVGAATIDSFDAHDGHPLTKGHIGVSVLPTLLALAELGHVKDGRDLLTSLVIGYEIGTRAGIALHRTACDYHTSGAWGAVACASLVARHLKLGWARTWQAMGTAEYHGPRSQMMRCVAEPTMVKDGSSWGAFAGVSAGFLAADGYTGAPVVTMRDPAVADLWTDFGTRWRILEQYFKAYPVCRWAQPATEAVASLLRAHALTAADIAGLELRSFANAIALGTRRPATTDEAQYSLAFPVAAFAIRGRLGGPEIMGRALKDPKILALSERMVLTEWPEFTRRFPAERLGQAIITTRDGRRLESEVCVARGSAENPLSDTEILEKFRSLAIPVLGRARSAAIEGEIAKLAAPRAPIARLQDLLLRAPAR